MTQNNPEKVGFQKYLNEKSFVLGLIVLFAISLLVLVSNSKNSNQYGLEKNTDKNTEDQSTDTFIPNGFVLVPIDLANGESLSPLIDNFATVDIFQTGQGNGALKKQIGKKVKLIRAPLNPQKFAVLVPENSAHMFMQSDNPFFAVLLNSRQRDGETSVVKALRKTNEIKFFEAEKR